MNESSRNERELAHWKAWQDHADKVWGWNTPAGKVRADRRAALFRELARMQTSTKAVEIGCGTGEFTARIAPCVKQLLATDLSPELLDHAKGRVTRCCPDAHVEFEVQDVTALTLAGSSFDAAFGCSVLHHVDATTALREVHRVLKPNGWCTFSEPNMLNPQIALHKNVSFLKHRVGDSPDETAFFRWELVRLLRQVGFEDITVRNFDFLHPLTPPSWMSIVARIGDFMEKCPVVKEISGS